MSTIIWKFVTSDEKHVNSYTSNFQIIQNCNQQFSTISFDFFNLIRCRHLFILGEKKQQSNLYMAYSYDGFFLWSGS